MAASVSSTRLNGSWLWVARLAWGIVLVLGAAKQAVGWPVLYAEKAIICTASAEICSLTESTTLRQAEAIEAAGMPLETYAKVFMGMAVFNTLVWVGIGLLIFILRSDDWMAMLVSAM